ncbi:Pol polyprotein [Acropora cervicornis]|uniref:Pol polyprotein n=1 Tax=Acropora cervicornis TaxID=6130 RepID=A0AAD9QA29_ACRCE|nr:Pol polyprotein [Acropora cervicornis]
MDEPSQLANATATERLLELGSVLDASLSDWNEELSAGSNQTQPSSGTKDPTKSVTCDAKLKKKGEKAPSTGSDASKKAVVAKTAIKLSHSAKRKSAPNERRTGSGLQQSATPGQSCTTDVAALLKEAFAGLALEMNKGFSSLGALLKVKNDAKGDDNAPEFSDPESDDHDSGSDKESEEPARKKQKTDDGCVLSKYNSDILNKLEKEFNVSEQDGADIHGNLANIVQKLLKHEPEEDKLNEVKKRYLRPKNCEMLAETRRARTSDLKLQKVQKSLIKGSTAVVQVVNDLISKPDMPSKVWMDITSDRKILDMVEHCHLEFTENPYQQYPKPPIKFNSDEAAIIDGEIQQLLEKGVLEETAPTYGQYVSTIFLRKKKNGSYRLILNLRGLNAYIEYQHFKVESLTCAIQLMKKNCYMASIDLTDACYTVPVALEHRKYLRFFWRNRLFQYTCLPNGLASAPRYFTKLLKPVYSTLRSQGYLNVGYIDDSYLQGDSKTECRNSVNMKVFLTAEKREKIILVCQQLLKKSVISIREVAHVIGLLVSSLPAVQHGTLFYRSLEIDKNVALQENNGNYDASMTLSSESVSDLNWWMTSLPSACKNITMGNPTIEMATDASNLG